MHAALSAQAGTVFDALPRRRCTRSAPNCRCRHAADAQRRTAAARERQPRRFAASRRRAVPARTDRRLCAPRGDRARTRPRRCACALRSADAAPYPDARDLRAPTSTVVAESLASHHSSDDRAPTRLQPLRARARHPRLPRRHARPAPELGRASSPSLPSCCTPPRSAPTTRSCPRPNACACWRANSRMRARCARRTSPTPRCAQRELAVFDAARELRARFGARAIDSTSSRTPNSCRICSRSRCCRRKPACSPAPRCAAAA